MTPGPPHLGWARPTLGRGWPNLCGLRAKPRPTSAKLSLLPTRCRSWLLWAHSWLAPAQVWLVSAWIGPLFTGFDYELGSRWFGDISLISVEFTLMSAQRRKFRPACALTRRAPERCGSAASIGCVRWGVAKGDVARKCCTWACTGQRSRIPQFSIRVGAGQN